jgi:hypothetical protein
MIDDLVSSKTIMDRGRKMKDVDKLRVLIPHWIEHNVEHAEEFRRWANQVGEKAHEVVTAADLMIQVNAALQSALQKLGGALEQQQEHHHHHSEV